MRATLLRFNDRHIIPLVLTLDTSIGRLRLFGVDTLERGDVCAADATELTRRLVGSQVRLEDGPRLAVSEFSC